jgi:hypothetical protein
MGIDEFALRRMLPNEGDEQWVEDEEHPQESRNGVLHYDIVLYRRVNGRIIEVDKRHIDPRTGTDIYGE